MDGREIVVETLEVGVDFVLGLGWFQVFVNWDAGFECLLYRELPLQDSEEPLTLISLLYKVRILGDTLKLDKLEHFSKGLTAMCVQQLIERLEVLEESTEISHIRFRSKRGWLAESLTQLSHFLLLLRCAFCFFCKTFDDILLFQCKLPLMLSIEF